MNQERLTPLNPTAKEFSMLSWALAFLVLAIIAALFGFGGVAGTAMGAAKILFFVFLVLFLVSLIFGGFRRSPGPEKIEESARVVGGFARAHQLGGLRAIRVNRELLAADVDVRRSLDADLDSLALQLQDSHDDVVVDHDLLANLARKNQHGCSLLRSW
jgi:uncharacterized membrane protein YtjA (UPF0391 family)